MNSNWKLLSAGLLVAALAGCGGGSGSGEDDMQQTPAEACAAKGQGYAIDSDGECKSLEDAKKEGAEEEGQKRDDDAAAEAAKALAKKLSGFLSPVVTADLLTSVPTDTDAAALLTDARMAQMKKSDDGKVVVVVMNTRGDGSQVDSVNADDSRPVVAPLLVAANARHIISSGFATGTNQVLDHSDMKGEGDRTVTGSYMGAMGVYTCPTGTCTSQRTDDGIRLVGTWTFTPNTGQKFTQPDAVYAEYGWWINEGIAADTNPKLGAFYSGSAGGTLPTADLTTSGATGSATYTGSAVGQVGFYHRLGDDANVGGAFTADAELTAVFGTDLTLNGEIDNFDIGGVEPGWVVKLKGGTITAGSGAVAVGAANTTTWVIDGTDGDALPSAWSAQLYDIPDGAHQPTDVVGGFKAQYESDGYMVGAFGAKQ